MEATMCRIIWRKILLDNNNAEIILAFYLTYRIQKMIFIIVSFLSNLAYSKDYIYKNTLYPLGRNPNLSTNTKHAEQDLNIEQKENKWWTYRSYEETVSGVQETVTLTRPVRSMSDFKDIGYLTISLNQEYLDDLLNSIDWEWDGTVLLSKDQLLLASNKDETIDDMNVRRILENVEDNEKSAFYPNN